MRLSGGEHQSFKIGDSQELDQRRSEMHGLLHSTSGMPHLEQSSSFRETISAAGDKKVLPSLVFCRPFFRQLSSRTVLIGWQSVSAVVWQVLDTYAAGLVMTWLHSCVRVVCTTALRCPDSDFCAAVGGGSGEDRGSRA